MAANYERRGRAPAEARGLALLLTAIGLYGPLALLILQRKRELAIRIALGAQRSRVIRLVARETLLLIGSGAAAAIPVAWMLGRPTSGWLTDVLYGLSPTDAPTTLSALMVLIAVGLAAVTVPARAATADPMQTLRSE